MNFRTWLFIFIGAVLVFLIVRRVITPAPGQQGNNAAAGAKPQALMVSAFVVKPQTITDKIISSGTALANEQADVKNEIAGRVIHIYFKEGSKVKKGDMLVKIYDADLQAQLRKLLLQQELSEKNEQRMEDLVKR